MMIRNLGLQGLGKVSITQRPGHLLDATNDDDDDDDDDGDGDDDDNDNDDGDEKDLSIKYCRVSGTRNHI